MSEREKAAAGLLTRAMHAGNAVDNESGAISAPDWRTRKDLIADIEQALEKAGL